jgi:hypothetical protein
VGTHTSRTATTKDVIFRDLGLYATVRPHTRSVLYCSDDLTSNMHNTPPSQLPPIEATRNSSTQFASISAQSISMRRPRQALGGPQPCFTLSASSLFLLIGQESTDLDSLVIACRPHRGSATSKRILIGDENQCSVIFLAVHDLR